MKLNKFLPPPPAPSTPKPLDKVHPRSARVLTSRDCLQELEEKDRLKCKKQKEKERRKEVREQKRAENEKAMTVRKAMTERKAAAKGECVTSFNIKCIIILQSMVHVYTCT